MALAAVMTLSLVSPALAANTGAAAGGNGDQYTHKDLFTHDMVTDNPGEVGYTSMYNVPEFMADRDYNGMTFSLFEAAQYGLLWDTYDQKVTGVNLTEEQYKANPDDPKVQEENAKKVFPFGSKERAWVETKRADIVRMYSAAKKAGQKTYFMQDIIVLPVKLKNDRKADICSGDNIDIRKPATQQIMDYMYEEMFQELTYTDESGKEQPLVDGIYVRYGETYTGERWGVPYHTGNNPIMGDQTAAHLLLMNYLRDEICVKLDKEIIYRTWGFGAFQNNPSTYLTISDKLEPHKNFYFAIKHTAGDFHRTVGFNQCLNIGKHQQIVEVQAAREYEGKGAFPNYIGDGVINGYEEYDWSMSASENQSLRDVINVKDTLVKGMWTWSRGGGWAGPYISGPGYPNSNQNDPYHDRTDGSIPVPNGSEMWDDLNAYVVTQWAKDTSRTDKEIAMQYATDILGMSQKDAESFYDLLIKSARAVLLGRARDNDRYGVNVWWFRDEGINPGNFWGNINSAYNNNAIDVMLAEKNECVQLWDEMLKIANGLEETGHLLPDAQVTGSTTTVKDYIVMTVEYGRYLFDIVRQMHIAGAAKVTAEKEAQKTGTTPNYPAEMKQAVDEYERLWAEWEKFYEANREKGCPTIFAKTANPFPGHNALIYSQPYDSAMTGVRFELTTSPVIHVPANKTAQISFSVSPYPASAVTFESSDNSVATVDKNGVVTGVKNGVARITATAGDGVLTSATLVKVTDESAGDQVLWKEDFSADVTEKWPGATWDQDGQCLNVTGNSTNVNYTFAENYQGKIRVSFDMKMDNNTGRCFMILKDASNRIIGQIDVRGTGVTNAGEIVMDQGGSLMTVVKDYEANKVYPVTLEMDTLAKTYTVKIGDNVVSLPFRDQAADGLNQLHIGSRSDVNFKLDNMVISKVATPEDPTAQEVADTIIELPAVQSTDKTLRLPALCEGYTAEIAASSNENVIGLDGTIKFPAEDTQVTLTLKVTRTKDGTTGTTKELTVTVPCSVSAEEVAKSLKFTDPEMGDSKLKLPEVPRGFTLRIVKSSNPDLISNYGDITVPDKDTTVTLTMRVTKEFGQAESYDWDVTINLKGYSAQDVADALTDIQVNRGDKFVILPEVPKGYHVSIVKSEKPAVVETNGLLHPGAAQSTGLTLKVTRDGSDVVGEKTVQVKLPAYSLDKVLEDKFETQQVGTDMKGEYKPNRNPENITLTVEKDGENQVLKLVQPDANSAGSILPTKTIDPLTGEVWLSADVKVEGNGGMYFIGYSDSGKKVCQIDFRLGGSDIILNSGSMPTIYAPYQTDTWYNLAARFNFDSRAMEIYVNGALCLKTEICDADAANLGRISLGLPGTSNNTVLYDNITVETIGEGTEPAAEYAVTVKTEGKGSASASAAKAAEGTEVTLTAQAASGWTFKGWKSDDVTVTNDKFAMPGKAVTVTAVFEKNADKEPASSDYVTKYENRPDGTSVLTQTHKVTGVVTETVFYPDGSKTITEIKPGGENSSFKFTDVPKGHWAEEEIYEAYKKGILNGTSETTFDPEMIVSRGQLFQVLYNMEKQPAVAFNGSFSDVKSGDWFASAVSWAVKNNVAAGYGNGTFGPDDSITREQLASVLYHYAGKPSAVEAEMNFTDADQVSGWAAEAMNWAVSEGLFAYCEGATLNPGQAMTRAELAVVLVNYTHNVK